MEAWWSRDVGLAAVAGGALLGELAGRPVWRDDAACRGRGDVDWFPARGRRSLEAEAVCAKCTVGAECLAEAIRCNDIGVRGGTYAGQRGRMMRGAGYPGSEAWELRRLDVATDPATWAAPGHNQDTHQM